MSTVSEIASNKGIVIITADTGKSAFDVADLMKNKKVGSVIVMDKESQPWVLLLNVTWSNVFV